MVVGKEREKSEIEDTHQEGEAMKTFCLPIYIIGSCVEGVGLHPNTMCLYIVFFLYAGESSYVVVGNRNFYLYCYYYNIVSCCCSCNWVKWTVAKMRSCFHNITTTNNLFWCRRNQKAAQSKGKENLEIPGQGHHPPSFSPRFKSEKDFDSPKKTKSSKVCPIGVLVGIYWTRVWCCWTILLPSMGIFQVLLILPLILQNQTVTTKRPFLLFRWNQPEK